MEAPPPVAGYPPCDGVMGEEHVQRQDWETAGEDGWTGDEDTDEPSL